MARKVEENYFKKLDMSNTGITCDELNLPIVFKYRMAEIYQSKEFHIGYQLLERCQRHLTNIEYQNKNINVQCRLYLLKLNKGIYAYIM